MPFSFPSNPTNGQTYTYNGKTWTYTTATGTWDANTTASIATAVAPITYNASTQAVGLSRVFNTTSASDKGLVIQGSASQTADLTQWQNSAGLVMAEVASDGSAMFGNQIYAGKNQVINGNFDIWQRGTSLTAGGWNADRWYSGQGGTVTISRQSSGVPVGSQYCLRAAYTSASSFANLFHPFDSATVANMLGRTVTVTAKVRANSTWAATSGLGLNMILETNPVGDNLTVGTWTAAAYTGVAANAIATGTGPNDWTTLSFSTFISNSSSNAGIRIHFGEWMAGPSGAHYEIAQVQLEIGSVATPFSRAGGTIQGELAACQRYYQTGQSVAMVQPTADGGGNYRSYSSVLLAVKMRTSPTIAITSYVAGTANKGTSNFFSSVYGGSQTDSTGTALGDVMSDSSFNIGVVNNTNGKFDATRWTASAELG